MLSRIILPEPNHQTLRKKAFDGARHTRKMGASMFILQNNAGKKATGLDGVFVYSTREQATIAARILGKRDNTFYRPVKQ